MGAIDVVTLGFSVPDQVKIAADFLYHALRYVSIGVGKHIPSLNRDF